MMYGLMTRQDFDWFRVTWIEEGRSPAILGYLQDNRNKRDILYGAQPWFRFDEYFRLLGPNKPYTTREVIEATLGDLPKGECEDLMLYLLKIESTLGWFRAQDVIFHATPPDAGLLPTGEFEGALRETMVIATAVEIRNLWGVESANPGRKTDLNDPMVYQVKRVKRSDEYFQHIGMSAGRVSEVVKLLGLPVEVKSDA